MEYVSGLMVVEFCGGVVRRGWESGAAARLSYDVLIHLLVICMFIDNVVILGPKYALFGILLVVWLYIGESNNKVKEPPFVVFFPLIVMSRFLLSLLCQTTQSQITSCSYKVLIKHMPRWDFNLDLLACGERSRFTWLASGRLKHDAKLRYGEGHSRVTKNGWFSFSLCPYMVN